MASILDKVNKLARISGVNNDYKKGSHKGLCYLDKLNSIDCAFTTCDLSFVYFFFTPRVCFQLSNSYCNLSNFTANSPSLALSILDTRKRYRKNRNIIDLPFVQHIKWCGLVEITYLSCILIWSFNDGWKKSSEGDGLNWLDDGCSYRSTRVAKNTELVMRYRRFLIRWVVTDIDLTWYLWKGEKNDRPSCVLCCIENRI